MTIFDDKHPAPRGELSLDRVGAVLFDLDGTLLGVDMQEFIPVYLEGLAERMVDLAAAHHIAAVMREAVIDMLTRVDGGRTLEQRLLAHLEEHLAIPAYRYRAALEDFCLQDLHGLRPLVQGHPLAPFLLEACHARGWQIVLATNPIFPRAIIDARIAWAGLDPGGFELVTDYETSRYCKPHREYFDEILAHLDMTADSCLMVGNDTQHDMAAGRAGLATCLLTPWRIDHKSHRFPADWEGTHEELLGLLQGQPVDRFAAEVDSDRTLFSVD